MTTTEPTPRHASAILPADGKYSAAWWKDTADRVVSTFAQGAIATITAGGTAPDLIHLEPLTVLAIAGGAAVLAFLKALAITRAPAA